MFNLPKIEEEVLARWKHDNTFKQSLEKPSPKGTFVFYEGPPTANGKPGIHHILARSFKDLIPRYKTMQGYHVARKAGWDTHGLPVELEVEKKLGLKNKQAVEDYGIEKFNEECKKSVWEYKEEWERMTERIAYWADMENPYVTYDNDYIETLWWVIKQWFDSELLYEGHKVVPHCPRCATALSSHEVAQGYKTVTEPSVYVKFELIDEPATFILAWTTTPWTLPGHVALAVGEDIDYVKISQGKENYILAKDRLEIVEGEYKVIEEIKGKDLLGKKYTPLFDSLVDTEGLKHEVVSADFVTTTDGTGVVHTAVMYGDDDYQLGDTLGLAKIHTVHSDGTFNERVKEFSGMFVKDAEADIITFLEKNNLLFKQTDYEHEYPFCWRCGTPLLYYAKDSWFVSVSSMQQQLLDNNESVNWTPEHIKHGRFGEWLNGVKDWAFSRERYWGTPLPIWRCNSSECGHLVAVGSYEELETLSSKKVEDPHRPFIDEFDFGCEKCGQTMKRVPDVCDVWFDSGAMPLAQYHYPFENKELIDGATETTQFPADYICEAVDQTRGWFYTLLAVSTMLGKGAPYKNVISLEFILDKKGQKMSKSKGNIVDPWEMIEKYGSDAIRWYFYTMSAPGDAKKFDEQGLKESARIFMTLLNVVSFFNMFAEGVEYEAATEKDLSDVLDLWISARLNQLTDEVTTKLDVYDITGAARSIEDFVTDLSTWYVRRSRDRFKSADLDTKIPAIRVLRRVLFHLTRIMAPFTPFVADYVYLEKLNGDMSVHLKEWSEVNFAEAINDTNVIAHMKVARSIVEAGLAARTEEKLPVRQPLGKITVKSEQFALGDEYLELIKDELNVKAVEFSGKEKELVVELDTHITPELKREGIKRELVRHINNLRKKSGLTINDKVAISVVSNDNDIKDAIKEYGQEILFDTLATEFADTPGGDPQKVNVSGEEVEISIIK